MRTLLALLPLLLVQILRAAPARAEFEPGGCFMGVCAGDINPEAELRKFEAEQEARRQQRAKGPGLLDFSWATPAQSDLRCVYAAVARLKGIQAKPEDAVPVYLHSRTLKDDYDSWVHNETGQWPKEFQTVYLPRARMIYVDDAKKNFTRERTLDDVIAGQYGLSLGIPAADAERAFHERYTKTGKSACEPSR